MYERIAHFSWRNPERSTSQWGNPCNRPPWAEEEAETSWVDEVAQQEGQAPIAIGEPWFWVVAALL
jgi:hypothetical protein